MVASEDSTSAVKRFLCLAVVLFVSCATTPPIPDEPTLPPEDGYATTAAVEPVVISEVKVPYPKAAREQGIGGTVRVKVYLNERGVVSRAEVIESFGYGLDEAALDAIRKFRFRPAQDKDGNPIPFLFVYRYTFVY
jgi:TonB family protein